MPKEIKNKFTRIEKKNIRTKEIAEEETKKKNEKEIYDWNDKGNMKGKKKQNDKTKGKNFEEIVL